jgi:hypothetical protein
MTYSVSWLLLLAGASLLGACQPNSLPPEALSTYVNDPSHGLRQVQQVGITEISVAYQPVDLLVGQELQRDGISQLKRDSLRKKYAGSTYFLLAISRNGREVLQSGESFSDYSGLLQTLAFQMGEHVHLLTSQGDTLRPTNYYLDRTYSSAGATQLLFAFPALPATGTWRFQMKECGIGVGNLSFLFKAPLHSPVLAISN